MSVSVSNIENIGNIGSECPFKIVRGDRKGQLCGKRIGRIGNNYCSEHNHVQKYRIEKLKKINENKELNKKNIEVE